MTAQVCVWENEYYFLRSFYFIDLVTCLLPGFALHLFVVMLNVCLRGVLALFQINLD